jgi:hypothetical protein
MENGENRDGLETASCLSGAELQWVARRQFTASIVVAAAIAVIAILIEIGPIRYETTAESPRRSSAIHRPSFAVPLRQPRMALAQRRIEVP